MIQCTFFVTSSNVLIHIFCVPIMYWCIMAMLASLPVVAYSDDFYLNISFFATILLSFYYFLLEPIAGVIHL